MLINDSQYIFLHFGIFDVNNSNIHFAKLIQAQVSTLLAQLNRKNRFVFGIEIDNCFMRLYIIYNSLGQILSVWYYHVTVILCITHTHYVVFRTKCAVFVQRLRSKPSTYKSKFILSSGTGASIIPIAKKCEECRLSLIRLIQNSGAKNAVSLRTLRYILHWHTVHIWGDCAIGAKTASILRT